MVLVKLPSLLLSTAVPIMLRSLTALGSAGLKRPKPPGAKQLKRISSLLKSVVLRITLAPLLRVKTVVPKVSFFSALAILPALGALAMRGSVMTSSL